MNLTQDPRTEANAPAWCVFAGGGTGGHLCPALAIVHELQRLDREVSVSFLCTDRPIDRHILGEAGLEALPQGVRPFSMKPWRWPGFYLAWRRAIRRCDELFARRQPAVVVGAGGYASGPALRAALARGKPTAILNPDLVPGRANRWFAGRVDRVFAQWEDSAAYLPGARGFRPWGCPVRPGFLAPREQLRAAGLARFGLSPERRTLLVTGASQGARTINGAIAALAPEIARSGDWQLLHLAGNADAERMQAAHQDAGVPSTVLAFTDHMPEAMAVADLAVSRAGASTLAELTAIGLPSILLPYPFHRDQHQRRNAEVLERAGAARIVEDRIDVEANASALRGTLLPLLQSPHELVGMAEAARRIGRPDAATRIAAELLAMAGRNTDN